MSKRPKNNIIEIAYSGMNLICIYKNHIRIKKIKVLFKNFTDELEFPQGTQKPKTPYMLSNITYDEIITVIEVIRIAVNEMNDKRTYADNAKREKERMLDSVNNLEKDLLKYGMYDEVIDHLHKIRASVKNKKVFAKEKYKKSFKEYLSKELHEINTSNTKKKKCLKLFTDAVKYADTNRKQFDKYFIPLLELI